MKHCPRCNRSYDDDELRFCLADGTVLSNTYDPEATQRIPPPRMTLPVTEIIQQDSPQSQPSRPGVKPVFVYILIALLALVVGGGLVMLLRPVTKEVVSVSNSTADVASANGSNQEQSKSSKPTEASRGSSDDRSSEIAPLTYDGVAALINRWRDAQNAGDFPAYQSCYALAFEGILRTASGRARSYTYAAWMQDRKKMIGQTGGVTIEVRNLRIRVEETVAIVEFDQFYRSSTYRDWGPKIMRVKMSPGGERIVFEELTASYPI